MSIIIIDNEIELTELVKLHLVRLGVHPGNVVTATNWSQVFPVAGDIVVHDLGGVGEPKIVSGARYLTFSGDINIDVDIPKPFSKELLKSKILGDK